MQHANFLAAIEDYRVLHKGWTITKVIGGGDFKRCHIWLGIFVVCSFSYLEIVDILFTV